MADDNSSIHPPDNQKSAEEFLKSLSPSDVKRLEWLLTVIGKIDGWCAVNRWIGKWIVVTALTFLVLLSGAVEAFQKLIGWKH